MSITCLSSRFLIGKSQRLRWWFVVPWLHRSMLVPACTQTDITTFRQSRNNLQTTWTALGHYTCEYTTHERLPVKAKGTEIRCDVLLRIQCVITYGRRVMIKINIFSSGHLLHFVLNLGLVTTTLCIIHSDQPMALGHFLLTLTFFSCTVSFSVSLIAIIYSVLYADI